MIIIQKSDFLGSQEDDLCFFYPCIDVISAVTVIFRMTLTCLTSINIKRAIFCEHNLRTYLFMLTLGIQVASVLSTKTLGKGIICWEPLSGEGANVVSALQTAGSRGKPLGG